MKAGFDMPAMRRLEIERYARAIDVADSDDFRPFLVAWQWHNPDGKDAAGALMMAAKRMGAAISEEEATQLIDEADATPKCRKADALGRYLQLTDELRTALEIRTIGSVDISKRQRAARRKEQKRALKREMRRKQGAKTRTEYLGVNSVSRLQPWKAERISRRTWYYRRKTALVPVQPSTRWRVKRQQDAADTVAACCAPALAASTRSDSRFTAYQLAQVWPQGSKDDWVRTCATQGKG
jgi:hypothetical protein